MEQDHHQQPVQKHSVADDTEQKHQPVEKKSISVAKGQKKNLQSGQNVDVFLSNQVKVSSLDSCRNFQTGQNGPAPATHTGKPPAAGVCRTEPHGCHQVGDNTKHLVDLMGHKITQLSEKVTMIEKERFVLHDELSKVKSDLNKFKENKEKLHYCFFCSCYAPQVHWCKH